MGYIILKQITLSVIQSHSVADIVNGLFETEQEAINYINANLNRGDYYIIPAVHLYKNNNAPIEVE